MNKKVLWITETAVMIAVLIVLQVVTKPMGQLVTGSCVNLVLGVAAIAGGLWCGVTVAVLSPFFAFLLHIGPALLPIVPMIAVGNAVLVVVLYFLVGKKPLGVMSYVAAVAAAAAKFVTLWLLVVKLMLPMLGLPEQKMAVMSAMFTWPQLITALIGGVIAVTIAPMIRKALDK